MVTSPDIHNLTTARRGWPMRVAMASVALAMAGLALFVKLEHFYGYWHWVKYPWHREASLFVLPALIGLGLSIWLFRSSPLPGLLSGSVFLRLIFDFLSNTPFIYRQREMYLQEAYTVDLHNIVFNYPAAINQAGLQEFLKTKPPGTMLYYKVIHLLFRPFVSSPKSESLYYLSNFAT